MSRKKGRRIPRKVILIVVEGETELFYFDSIRELIGKTSSIVIDVRKKRDTNCEGLLKTCIWEQEHNLNVKEGDRIYCVCDHPGRVSSNAQIKIDEAKSKGVSLIMTRPCFELWLLLHFTKVYKPYNSRDIIRELRKYDSKYKKADKRTYSKVCSRTQDAIQNSRAIYTNDPKAMNNPSTNMSDLMNYLMRFIK
jgi:hypothetical protein